MSGGLEAVSSGCLPAQRACCENVERYVFIVSLIVGVGALIAIGFGLAGFFQGAFHLDANRSIILIAAGGAAAALMSVIAGIIKAVNWYLQDGVISTSTDNAQVAQKELNKQFPDLRIYDKEDWSKLLVEVDDQPEIPRLIQNQLGEKQKSHTLLLVPKEASLSRLGLLANSKEIQIRIDDEIQKASESKIPDSYWILISNTIEKKLKGQTFLAQQDGLREASQRMPSIREILSLIIMRHSSNLPIDTHFYCYGNCGKGRNILISTQLDTRPKAFNAILFAEGGPDYGTHSVIEEHIHN